MERCHQRDTLRAFSVVLLRVLFSFSGLVEYPLLYIDWPGRNKAKIRAERKFMVVAPQNIVITKKRTKIACAMTGIF